MRRDALQGVNRLLEGPNQRLRPQAGRLVVFMPNHNLELVTIIKRVKYVNLDVRAEHVDVEIPSFAVNRPDLDLKAIRCAEYLDLLNECVASICYAPDKEGWQWTASIFTRS